MPQNSNNPPAQDIVTWPGRLAPYATRADESRGRLYSEPESKFRSAFQRDRDRVIHCSAFRRLKHKTQVFVYHEGDYYRTRLTHTLEVAQIARTLSRALGLDEDLAEAVALAHDFGHTPFGHAGEEALDQAMADYGGFDHNAQTLRILTKLERRYAEFDGLNLCWETLEGVVKHNGPLTGAKSTGDKKVPIAAAVREYVAGNDLELNTFAGPEAQVAAIADDIAYNSHDLDDGLRAKLFGIDDLRDLSLVGETVDEVRSRYPGIEPLRLVHETVRRIIGALVEDVVAETSRRLASSGVSSAADVRNLDDQVAVFSEAAAKSEAAIKSFLFVHMYRHPKVNVMTDRARSVVADLFHHFMAAYDQLPDEWREIAMDKRISGDVAGSARVVADYIAGMTDGYALDIHGRL
jgi:dGTPase